MPAVKSENDNIQILYRGIRGIFHSEQGKKLERLEVNHVLSDGGNSTVISLRGEGELSGMGINAESIGDKIFEIAKEDAKPQYGLQNYIVLAYADEDRNHFRAIRFTIVGKGLKERAESFEGSEPANERGLAAMAMRHSETYFKQMVQEHENILRKYESLVDMFARDRREQSEVILKLTAQQVRVIEVTQDALDRTSERDLNIKREERSDALKAQMAGNFLPLMGPLLAKLLGNGAPAQAASSSHALLTSFLSSMTGEQLDEFVGHLTDEQKPRFVELYKLVRDHGTDGTMAGAIDDALVVFIKMIEPTQFGDFMNKLSDTQRASFIELYQQVATRYEGQLQKTGGSNGAPAASS